jgi:hypothetical protein
MVARWWRSSKACLPVYRLTLSKSIMSSNDVNGVMAAAAE